MKLLALNGSHKKTGGNTQLIVDNLLLGATAAGARTETVRLSQCRIKQCLACESCQKRTGYGCVHDDDDFLSIVGKMRSSDIVVYATPVYIFQMSSMLKIFLERLHSRGKSHVREFSKANLMFHDLEREAFSKPFVSVLTASNIERETTGNIERYFATFSRFMDAPRVGSVVRNGCSLLLGEGDARASGRLQQVLADTRAAGEMLAATGAIPRRLSRRIAANALPLPRFFYEILKNTRAGREKILAKSGMARR